MFFLFKFKKYNLQTQIELGHKMVGPIKTPWVNQVLTGLTARSNKAIQTELSFELLVPDQLDVSRLNLKILVYCNNIESTGLSIIFQ